MPKYSVKLFLILIRSLTFTRVSENISGTPEPRFVVFHLHLIVSTYFMNTKPYVIGICGGTASGKTYLLDQLINQFPKGKVCLLSLDNYYKPLEEQLKDEEGLVNFDDPQTLEMAHFLRDVNKLVSGERVIMQEFTFNKPTSTGNKLIFEPAPILILEGIFVFYLKEIRELIDLKIFVEADEHIRLSRRLIRDQEERGYELSYILYNYSKYVAPMYEKYVAPTRKLCDIIIPNNKNMNKAVELLVNHLKLKMT